MHVPVEARGKGGGGKGSGVRGGVSGCDGEADITLVSCTPLVPSRNDLLPGTWGLALRCKS